MDGSPVAQPSNNFLRNYRARLVVRLIGNGLVSARVGIGNVGCYHDEKTHRRHWWVYAFVVDEDSGRQEVKLEQTGPWIDEDMLVAQIYFALGV